MHHLIAAKSTVLLILAMHAAAGMDAYTTRRLIVAPCACFHETNPLVRPFAHSPAVYAAVSGDAIAVDIMLIRHPKSRLARSAAMSVILEHTAFAVHNLALYSGGIGGMGHAVHAANPSRTR